MPIPNARQVFFPFNLCTFPVWKWLWVSSQCYKGIHLFVYVTTSLGIWHQSVSERFVWRTALIVKLKVCNVFVFNCISVQSSRETETEELTLMNTRQDGGWLTILKSIIKLQKYLQWGIYRSHVQGCTCVRWI